MASVNQANQARDKVLGVPELFEQILLQLPPKQLFAAQRVSSHWKETIQQSPNIQRACFLRSVNDDKVKCTYNGEVGDEYHSLSSGKRITPVWNCLTPCDLNLRPWVTLSHKKVKEWVENDPDASWKEMFTTQPPSLTLEMGFQYQANTFEPPGITHPFLLTREQGITFMDVFEALYRGFEAYKSEIEGPLAKQSNPFRKDKPHWRVCLEKGWNVFEGSDRWLAKRREAGTEMPSYDALMEEIYWEHVSLRTDWVIYLDETDLRNMKINFYEDVHKTSAAEVLRQMAPVFVEEKDEGNYNDGFCTDRPKRVVDRDLMKGRAKEMGVGFLYDDSDDEEESEESDVETEHEIDTEYESDIECEHEQAIQDEMKAETEDEDELDWEDVDLIFNWDSHRDVETGKSSGN